MGYGIRVTDPKARESVAARREILVCERGVLVRRMLDYTDVLQSRVDLLEHLYDDCQSHEHGCQCGNGTEDFRVRKHADLPAAGLIIPEGLDGIICNHCAPRLTSDYQRIDRWLESWRRSMN